MLIGPVIELLAGTLCKNRGLDVMNFNCEHID